ncbi:hypothetical protein RJ639_031240 [Escallonia herrerae]|uniref:RRM domain-containing protein n=1 Tax=Escallonia herrerae TaxID=1293975 RepID=A0AA89BD29_9ASTE|nr:hypothetical protein RJ639_031240 [Escallonia herrerae]
MLFLVLAYLGVKSCIVAIVAYNALLITMQVCESMLDAVAFSGSGDFMNGDIMNSGMMIWLLHFLNVVVGLGGTPLHANRPILGLAFVFNSSQPSKLALDVPIRQLKFAPAFCDPALQKLYVGGLGHQTTSERLQKMFSVNGELENAVVIPTKSIGAYGFFNFKHVEGALLALKEPTKQLDGAETLTKLANLRNYENDATKRRVYVEGLSRQMSAQRLLAYFSSYGEVKGSFGFDRRTGKSQVFALFEYKTADGARASLVDPTKIVDSHHLICRYANDGKKGKQPSSPPPPLMLHYVGLGGSVGSAGSGWWVQTPTIDLGAGGADLYGGIGGGPGGGSSVCNVLPPGSIDMLSVGYPAAKSLD